MTKKDKIGIAIIGCGHWGPNHIRIFNSLPDCEVLMVSDVDTKRLKVIEQMYPSIACTNDYKKTLHNDDINAIIVATPASMHYKIVCEALRLNKHVLCEKPLCTTYKESEAVYKIAKDNNVILAVGYVFLFNNGILKLKELISKKYLGNLHYLSIVRTNLGPIRSDVNVVFDLVSHDISILNFLFGTLPEYVLAVGGSYLQSGIEDVAFISLVYPSGLIANIRASWLDPHKVRRITVVGDKKMATWNDLDPLGAVTIYEKGVIKEPFYTDYAEFIRISIRDGDITIPKIEFAEPLKNQNQHFISAIKQNKKPINDAGLDADVIMVIEAINKSIK